MVSLWAKRSLSVQNPNRVVDKIVPQLHPIWSRNTWTIPNPIILCFIFQWSLVVACLQCWPNAVPNFSGQWNYNEISGPQFQRRNDVIIVTRNILHTVDNNPLTIWSHPVQHEPIELKLSLHDTYKVQGIFVILYNPPFICQAEPKWIQYTTIRQTTSRAASYVDLSFFLSIPINWLLIGYVATIRERSLIFLGQC